MGKEIGSKLAAQLAAAKLGEWRGPGGAGIGDHNVEATEAGVRWSERGVHLIAIGEVAGPGRKGVAGPAKLAAPAKRRKGHRDRATASSAPCGRERPGRAAPIAPRRPSRTTTCRPRAGL